MELALMATTRVRPGAFNTLVRSSHGVSNPQYRQSPNQAALCFSEGVCGVVADCQPMVPGPSYQNSLFIIGCDHEMCLVANEDGGQQSLDKRIEFSRMLCWWSWRYRDRLPL